jgi:hypothetical protein
MYFINIFEVLISALLLALNISVILSECPESELIKPCSCKENQNYTNLMCGGNTTINLDQIFTQLSIKLSADKKHFNGFHLNNTAINELKENTFKDITFNTISIENCNNLTSIHKNAFTTTDLVTNGIHIWDNSKLIT